MANAKLGLKGFKATIIALYVLCIKIPISSAGEMPAVLEQCVQKRSFKDLPWSFCTRIKRKHTEKFFFLFFFSILLRPHNKHFPLNRHQLYKVWQIRNWLLKLLFVGFTLWGRGGGGLCVYLGACLLRVSLGGGGGGVQCLDCGKLSTEWMSKKTGIVYTGFDISRRLVAAASANGMSFSQVKRLFALLNMPPPMNEKTGYQF